MAQQQLRSHVRLSASSSPRRRLPVTVLIIGLVLWGNIMYACLAPFQFLSTTNSLGFVDGSTPSRRGLREAHPQEKDEEDSGWHPIHVFFGKRSALLSEEEVNKKLFSQVHQDEVILDLLGDAGYFIDLASNDAKEFSNTLALEKQGWDGLCIEPNPMYWYGLSHRKCTVVGALVGGGVEEVDVKFRGVYGGIVGKMDDGMANRKREPDAATEKRFTAPITDVLERFRVPKRVDYMSLDVEGAEFLIMQNFPFDQYQIKVLTVERPNKQLKSLLNGHGYIFLKDLSWWGETLWAHESTGFTPDHPKIVKIQTEERN